MITGGHGNKILRRVLGNPNFKPILDSLAADAVDKKWDQHTFQEELSRVIYEFYKSGLSTL